MPNPMTHLTRAALEYGMTVRLVRRHVVPRTSLVDRTRNRLVSSRSVRRTFVGTVVALLLAGCAANGPSVSAPSPFATSITVSSGTPLGTVDASPSLAALSAPPVSPIPALEARLDVPVGLVFDASGNLYVSQCASKSVIYRIDPGGLMTPFAGRGLIDYAGDGGPATFAAIACPVGMAFGPDGALYFADHANNRVRRIDSAGVITTVAGSGPAGVNQGSFSGDGGPAVNATLQEPWDLAFDRDGNFFIADRDNHRVRKVDPNGVITTVAGDGERRFAGDGGPAVGASLSAPLGVAVSSAGDLLIADSGNDRVRKVDLHGMISTYLGTGTKGFSGDGGPATAATIDEPHDFAFDASGALLVSTGDRIRRIDTAGAISTIAGTAGTGPLPDEIPAIRAHFGEIHGLAFDDAGNLFLADGGFSVYRIDTKGMLTLFAGRRP
jgi:sugar lactone lactonase YvrE